MPRQLLGRQRVLPTGRENRVACRLAHVRGGVGTEQPCPQVTHERSIEVNNCGTANGLASAVKQAGARGGRQEDSMPYRCDRVCRPHCVRSTLNACAFVKRNTGLFVVSPHTHMWQRTGVTARATVAMRQLASTSMTQPRWRGSNSPTPNANVCWYRRREER